MRCIEILLQDIGELTTPQININMRCIEINDYRLQINASVRININMRCIEIGVVTGLKLLMI